MKALKAQQARLELFLKSLLTTSIQPSKILQQPLTSISKTPWQPSLSVRILPKMLHRRNNLRLMMKLKICMILYPNKSSKIERKYPPHKKTKVKERRKYSMGQLEIVARVELDGIYNAALNRSLLLQCYDMYF